MLEGSKSVHACLSEHGFQSATAAAELQAVLVHAFWIVASLGRTWAVRKRVNSCTRDKNSHQPFLTRHETVETCDYKPDLEHSYAK